MHVGYKNGHGISTKYDSITRQWKREIKSLFHVTGDHFYTSADFLPVINNIMLKVFTLKENPASLKLSAVCLSESGIVLKDWIRSSCVINLA